MTKRVSPIERIRIQIDELFSSERDLAEVLEEVGRMATRLLMQSAIEAEVTEFLGRDRYARGERGREGSRNGFAPTTVKTTAGPIELFRPKLRGTDEAFASRLFGKGVTAPMRFRASSSPATSGACRRAMSRRPWPTRSVTRLR